MSETAKQPIEAVVGFGKIHALWFDDTAIWTGRYNPHVHPGVESMQLARRKKNLIQNFHTYRMLQPTIEIVDGDQPETEGDAAGKLLRVTTLVMPYVDPTYLRPIIEMGYPGVTHERVERYLIERDLMFGGAAISDAFSSAMTKH